MPGDTVKLCRLLFPPRAARRTLIEYVLGMPFCAVTTILIKVFDPAPFNGMVRACPEPVPGGVTVIVALGSCRVGVIVILATLLATFIV